MREWEVEAEEHLQSLHARQTRSEIRENSLILFDDYRASYFFNHTRKCLRCDLKANSFGVAHLYDKSRIVGICDQCNYAFEIKKSSCRMWFKLAYYATILRGRSIFLKRTRDRRMMLFRVIRLKLSSYEFDIAKRIAILSGLL